MGPRRWRPGHRDAPRGGVHRRRADDSGDSGDSGNAEVQAYCDQVADFADEVAAADSDPELVDLEATGQELSQAAADLSANGAPVAPDSEAVALIAYLQRLGRPQGNPDHAAVVTAATPAH